MLQYRKEIDGLRAVAVVSVILFHANIGGFPGGFVGVDVFLVISGYLITNIIRLDLKKGRFSLLSFYERRVRRIIPALTVVLLFSVIGSVLLMPRYLLEDFFDSMMAVSLFGSNIYFMNSINYFSPLADENPLFHTWSLAIEEQYYVFFPVILMLIWFRGRRWIKGSIIVVVAFSFISMFWFLSSRSHISNFYHTLTRTWELLFGAAIPIFAWDHLVVPKPLKQAAGLFGLASILLAVFSFDQYTPFPSAWTLFPVLGTCLVIVFATGDTIVGRLLSLRPIVICGLISYSLYLWHQPLLAFVRVRSVGEPSWKAIGTVLLIASILSFLSWRYVERPFRTKEWLPRKRIFQLAISSLVICLAIGAAGHACVDSIDDSGYEQTAQHSPQRDACHVVGDDYIHPQDACRYFGEEINWAVLGDSHVVEPAYAIAKKLEKKNQGVLHLSYSACPPAYDFDYDTKGCHEWLTQAVNYLKSETDIEKVLVGFRYSYYLFGDQLDSYPEIPNINPVRHFLPYDSATYPGQAREMFWDSFQKIITVLTASGKQVYVLHPVPELPVHIRKIFREAKKVKDIDSLDMYRTTPVSYYMKRNQFILNKLKQLEGRPNVHSIEPRLVFCEGNYCSAVKDGKAIYFDDEHLSVAGAVMLFDMAEFEKSFSD